MVKYNFRSNSVVSHREALLYAGGMVILNGIGVLTINQLFMTGYYNGMKARVAVSSIIFRKVIWNFTIYENYETQTINVVQNFT